MTEKGLHEWAVGEWSSSLAAGAAMCAALRRPRVFGFVFGQCKKENSRHRVAYEVNARRPSVMWLAQQTHGLGSEVILEFLFRN